MIILLVTMLGVVDPVCTLEQVCAPGYTDGVRPSHRYTTKLKIKQMQAMHLPGDPSQYEEDHLISLGLCGAPRDPANLVPEIWEKARKKDIWEARFHKDVCAGIMTLKDAQKRIVKYE